jgi:hypothetical protein
VVDLFLQARNARENSKIHYLIFAISEKRVAGSHGNLNTISSFLGFAMSLIVRLIGKPTPAYAEVKGAIAIIRFIDANVIAEGIKSNIE